MKACSKCGAENPDSNQYCARCEMPLPKSGAGHTLAGGPSGARGAPAGLSRQETLFGISPEQMSGLLASQPSPAAPPAKPAAPAAPPSPAPAVLPSAGGGGSLMSGGVPLKADSPVPNRTLLGVMPDDMAQAVAAARERAPTREKSARAPGEVAGPARGSNAPVQTPQAARLQQTRTPQVSSLPDRQRPPHGTAVPGVEALRGGTVVGSTSAPRAPAARAEAPVAAREPGTVRSIVSEAERAPAAPRRTATSIEAALELPEEEVEANDLELPMHARTHLGVAIPGVAPLHAGLGNAPAPRAAPPLLDATLLQPDSLSGAPLSARSALPRGALVLLGSGLLLLLAAGAFALMWRAEKPISVAISADASGKDRIDLVCAECPDGTLVSLKESRAEISSRKAYLTLAEPLPLGENKASFGLQRPGAKEPEAVTLTLPPVEYRIRPDTSTLAGDQPRLTLRIAAIPGSKVEIAAQPVVLDAQGNGDIAVDLSGQLIGPAPLVTTFEQSIAYSVTPPSGKVYAGELSVKIGVTPLLLEAPGIDTVTDLERFMLAGRTTKGAELWVAGTTIAVDPSGRFAQLMSIDSVGETRVTVRATEPGLAPRFVSFRLQRVENLEGELEARRRKAVPVADVTRSIADHIGSTVVFSGRVEEVRLDGHRSLIILQAEGDCGGHACLVRLVYGGLRKLSRGDAITGIGRLQGSVGTPNPTLGSLEVPEVDVSLLL